MLRQDRAHGTTSFSMHPKMNKTPMQSRSECIENFGLCNDDQLREELLSMETSISLDSSFVISAIWCGYSQHFLN